MRLIPESLYDELIEYLTDRHDIRDGSDGPLPNTAMRLTTELEQCERIAA